MKQSARLGGRFRVPRYLRHAAHDRGFANYYDPDGQRRRKYFPGAYDSPESRRAFIGWLNAWEAANGASRATGPTVPLTVGVLTDRFLCWADDYFQKNGRPTGAADNYRDAVRELIALFGTTPVAEFGPKRLRQVRDAMVESRRLARKTINRRARMVIRVFSWGVEEELVPGHVPKALREVKALQYGRTVGLRESKGRSPVADEHVEAVLPFMTPTVRAMVQFAYFTGARPGEVCSLRWCDVDRSDPECWVYMPPDHKTAHLGHDRAVTIGPRARKVLEPFLGVAPDQPVFSPTRSERERRAMRRQGLDPRTFTPSRRARDRQRADNPRRKLAGAWTTGNFRQAVQNAIHRANAEILRRRIASEFEGDDSVRDVLLALPRSSLIDSNTGALRLDLQVIRRRLSCVVADEVVDCVQMRVKTASIACESVPNWSPNQLRHNFEARAELEVGLERTSRAMGHSTLATTENYRSKIDVDTAKEVAREMG